jgi:PilZ domain
METAITPAKPKIAVKAALVGVPADAANILRECFRQFGIEAVGVDSNHTQRLNQEKFAACVVSLDEDAETVLELVRNSRSNSRVVVYGISLDPSNTRRWARYGVNAVFPAPVDRQNALRVVRSTYLLVLHEFRRYVRLPIISDVTIETPQGISKAASVEVSAGGMSLHAQGLRVNDDVTVTFDLPGRSAITLLAKVCWVRPQERTTGIRFDAADARRSRVKEWIEQYLEF